LKKLSGGKRIDCITARTFEAILGQMNLSNGQLIDFATFIHLSAGFGLKMGKGSVCCPNNAFQLLP
jgi:hypothetical protein